MWALCVKSRLRCESLARNVGWRGLRAHSRFLLAGATHAVNVRAMCFFSKPAAKRAFLAILRKRQTRFVETKARF